MRPLALFLLVLSSWSASAQDPDSLSRVTDEANRLGRLLFAYDQAAWHGTDAVLPMLQAETDPSRLAGYIVEATEDGWRVGFGRLSSDSSAFMAAYESELDTAYAVMTARRQEKPVKRTGFPRDAMMARQVALQRFVPTMEVTHNTAVLPADSGRVYVYVLPAQPANNVYYVGGDTRYEYDPATRRIVDEVRLHTSILTFDLSEEPGATSFASAVLTEAPTETDVFYAMSRPFDPPEEGVMQVSHYVMAGDWVFILGADGIQARLPRSMFDRSGASPDDAAEDESD